MPAPPDQRHSTAEPLRRLLCARDADEPLQPWHTLPVQEPPAAALRGMDWDAYVAAEAHLLDAVQVRLAAALPSRTPPSLPGRYAGEAAVHAGNRSFRALPDGPVRGAAVLVHGLSDAPYSLHSLAALYRAHGHAVVVPRLPGHGSVPAALGRVERAQWQAVLALAIAEARRLAGAGRPLQLVGYSNGAALVLLHELARLARGEPAVAERLVLLSPMIAVGAFAAHAGLGGLAAHLPLHLRAAWVRIRPEYDPCKYTSLPVHAARESFRLTRTVQAALDELQHQGRLHTLPPVLAFQSALDATVDADAVATRLLDRLPAGGHALVVFDVNRAHPLAPFLRPGLADWGQRLLDGPMRPYAVSVVGAGSTANAMASVRHRAAGEINSRSRALAQIYPPDLLSLSHVALPFPPDDPLYGATTARAAGLATASPAARGETGVLRLPREELERIGHNPFHAYLCARIAEGLH
ncbi:alpha/beta hydrolase [Thermomonas flagellata]|uniref:alpha/beta hydrolase n=1 Tax=Thermomonas flagellata TaxID=2888524 RepID=UPI001F04FDB6|nr:alpha/beta hydrolase [Thermomonas flagellata]